MQRIYQEENDEFIYKTFFLYDKICLQNITFYVCRLQFFRNFILHQKKGGIHEIHRYYMDTFGNFLVSRTVRKNILRLYAGATINLVAFFIAFSFCRFTFAVCPSRFLTNPQRSSNTIAGSTCYR